jgi:hypothetical protein
MSPRTYVGWNWRGSDSNAVSNSDGSITSTVSANTTAGFSVVTYTGTGSDATVGHGLGKEVAMVIQKRRSGADDWSIYHKELGKDKYIVLNSTNAEGSLSNFWGTSTPNSTVFGLLGGGYGHNKSGSTHVAYCFAEIEGYSKIGSYTGNGSTDGVFVYTGFRPKYLLQKRTNTSGQGWAIQNSDNQSYNEINNYLLAQSTGSTFSGYAQIDFLSNGFKIRSSDAQTNGSGDTYIYYAIAENPFSTSGGVPVTAR